MESFKKYAVLALLLSAHFSVLLSVTPQEKAEREKSINRRIKQEDLMDGQHLRALLKQTNSGKKTAKKQAQQTKLQNALQTVQTRLQNPQEAAQQQMNALAVAQKSKQEKLAQIERTKRFKKVAQQTKKVVAEQKLLSQNNAKQSPQPLQTLQLTMPAATQASTTQAPAHNNSNDSKLLKLIKKIIYDRDPTTIDLTDPLIEPVEIKIRSYEELKKIIINDALDIDEITSKTDSSEDPRKSTLLVEQAKKTNDMFGKLKTILNQPDPENTLRLQMLYKFSEPTPDGKRKLKIGKNLSYIVTPPSRKEQNIIEQIPARERRAEYSKIAEKMFKAQERNRQARIQAMKWAAGATLVGTTITLGHYNKLPVNTQRLFDQAATSLNQTFTPLANTALNGAAYYTPNAVKSGWNSFSSSLASKFSSLGSSLSNTFSKLFNR